MSSQPGQESDNTRTITNSGKRRHKPTALGEDALKPITLGKTLKHKPGTLTGDDKGVKFFAILSVQVKIYASASVRSNIFHGYTQMQQV